MIMAAAARKCEAQPDRRRCLYTILHILDARLLGDAPALAVDHVVSMKACRYKLLLSRLRQ